MHVQLEDILFVRFGMTVGLYEGDLLKRSNQEVQRRGGVSGEGMELRFEIISNEGALQ